MAPRIGAVLSLTGRFARFGGQAATGLRVWRELTGGAEVEIVDDGSSPAAVGPALDDLAQRCDLLLGPYGTSTARAAATWARSRMRLVWNHGGAGSDVQSAAPGRFVSVITPTERYADPFVRHLSSAHPDLALRLVEGPGSFGRTVVHGARRSAAASGVPLSGSGSASGSVSGSALFVAGTFEHDTEVVASLRERPAVLGTVAAGVLAFADAVPDPDGVLGIAQWTPGADRAVGIGPDERSFVDAYRAAAGTDPDYPAVQAAATASIALHCASRAGGADADALWRAATALRTTTLYGDFGIDPATGAQIDHTTVLVQWREGALVPVVP